MTAVQATALGKRYRRRWALREFDVEIPEGAVVALVGPNGAGKTTFLHLAAGLIRPTTGAVRVFDHDVSADDALLPRIGLVAQDSPLYRTFTVQDTLRLGRELNPSWDGEPVIERLEQLGIPMDQKVGTLSGGQRAQVALAVALGKRPELLLLDEPLANLDPLARRELLQTLMRTAAERPLTIVLSSHLISDLNRVCDHLVLVTRGRTLLAGSIEELLATHRVLIGPPPKQPIPGVAAIIDQTGDERQATMVVRTKGPLLDPRWADEDIGLEDLVLAHLAENRAGPRSDPEPESLRAVGAVS
jgi:ABC-2 type transport system ATP-binding protein